MAVSYCYMIMKSKLNPLPCPPANHFRKIPYRVNLRHIFHAYLFSNSFYIMGIQGQGDASHVSTASGLCAQSYRIELK